MARKTVKSLLGSFVYKICGLFGSCLYCVASTFVLSSQLLSILIN